MVIFRVRVIVWLYSGLGLSAEVFEGLISEPRSKTTNSELAVKPYSSAC